MGPSAIVGYLLEMPKYDASAARCDVFSYKDGPLARAAHDLHLRVTRFSVEIDDERQWVRASFDPSSFEVVAAIVEDGSEEALTSRDLQKILDHVDEDVLRTNEFPSITFVSTEVRPSPNGFRIMGDLTLKSQSKQLSLEVATEGDTWVAHATIDQPSFGIEPFKALMGAIRIKPEVRVTVSVPRH